MCSPPPPPDAGDPASQPIFTDEILGEIFLRLDAAADLARASAACTAFLRVVRFLRRNRSLPPTSPSLDSSSVKVALASTLAPSTTPSDRTAPPPPLATSRRPRISTAPFSPSPARGWSTTPPVAACSCPRAPPTIRPTSRISWCATPFHRRYVRIPPIPADLTAGTSGAYGVQRFLAPTGEEEGSSFRVVWMTPGKRKATAFIFSSATGQWRRVTFNGWNGYCTVMFTTCRYHPHRSLYKTSGLFSEVLILDTHKMVFAVVRTPRARHLRLHAIVEAGEGRLGFLTIGDGMLDLYCKAWQDNGVSAEEWQHEKTIPIPLLDSDRYYISFCGTSDGYLLIQAIPPESAELEQMPEIHYFTRHLKTLLVERFCLLNKRVDFAHLYANFLPPLSLPSV